ncbi:hypothetical protein DSX90_001610 [Campylobacter jejuni]
MFAYMIERFGFIGD